MFRRTRTYPTELRERARQLRRAGFTYTEIIQTLGDDIPQPTIQSWVKDIVLTTEQQTRIKQKEVESARKAQPLGALWNRLQKQKRIQDAHDQAEPHTKRLSQDREALQLMAAALYIGEGAKGENQFSFANSDPQVIRTWITLLRRNFEIDESKFVCRLAISVGMNDAELMQYWSDITRIPLGQFTKSSIKKNPGKVRREGYKGVCIVAYHSSAIRRYLDALAQGVVRELLQDE